MPIVSRREFFSTAAAGVALSAAATAQAPANPAATGLKTLTTDAKPITVTERQARLEAGRGDQGGS